MGRRLDRTARRLGLDPASREVVGRAFRSAMEARGERVAGDHHPDYLHPARTALILMDDAAIADAHTLAAALLFESRDPTLAVGATAVREWAPAVALLLADLERAGAADEDRRIEALVGLPAPAAMVAAAERLDHARHLHLRPRDEWEAYHRVTCTAYAPAAARAHPALGDRLAWWCKTFRRRFLSA